MKAFLLAIAAVQILHCSGVPKTKHALRASVVKLNEITEITNLCGVTRRRAKNIYHSGKMSYKVDLTFTVKETVCSKNSTLEFDDPSCHFRSKKIAEKGFCKSHVEYFADNITDIDVECKGLKTFDSGSNSLESIESSFEVQKKANKTSVEKKANAKKEAPKESLEKSLNIEIKPTVLPKEQSKKLSNEQKKGSRGKH
ncbi:secreted phosphoprotein 24-like [Rhinoraja longicauda]